MSATAAILNFFLWGAGYIYKGRTIAGLLFLAGFLLVHYYWLFVAGIQVWMAFPGILVSIGHILMSLALAYDVYK